MLNKLFKKFFSYCRLEEIDPYISGSLLFLRFKAKTGDAMGMNMISKAANAAMKHILKVISNKFPDMRPKYLSLSGNMCVDKKASATNWFVF
jgi:hydroxymethylglutaryl-CoA reductase (NADPH)